MAKKGKTLVGLDVPHYGYWQAIYKAFYSLRLYVDVGKRWKGFGFLYLLLILCLFTIPLAYRVILDFNRFFENQLVEPLKKLPPVVILNGQISVDKPMPFFIKDDQGAVKVIIDTTDKINTMDLKKWPKLTMLINKNKITYKVPDFELNFPGTKPEEISSVTTQNIEPGSNEIINPGQWVSEGKLSSLKLFIEVLIYPTLVTLFLSILVAVLVVVALMGQLFAKLISFSITYHQACRMLAVAVTAPLLILMILLTINKASGKGIFLLILLIIYFCLGIIALKNDSKRIARI